jgi:hypothetical protein
MPDLAVPPPNSLYPQPPKQNQFDPGQLLDLIGKVTRNDILQRELKSRAAIGSAYQDAIGDDGSFDPAKLASGLRSNPDAAWGLPEAFSRSLEQQQTQTDLRQQQDQAARSVLGTLPVNASDEQLRHYAATLSRAGVPAPLVAGHLDYLMGKTGRERAAAIRDLQNTAIGPAGVAQRVPGPRGPSGEETSVPLGEANRAGGMPIGLPLGATESSGVMQADLARARNFGQEMFPWSQALDAANTLKDKYGTGYFGPSSKARQEFAATFYTLAPQLAKTLGVDPDKLKNYAIADKYLTQAMQTRAAGFGHGTDAQLATTLAGSPNVGVTDLALHDLIKGSIALKRAEQAQTLTASRAGPQDYLNAASAWPAFHDVRAYTIDMLTPDARNKLIKSLSPAELNKFRRTLREAYETGVLQPPGGK